MSNIRTIRVKAPYLHPSQRNLKSEQIGPSSHKNTYHQGCLEGNWPEDRAGVDQNYQPAKLESTTVSRASYQPINAPPPVMATAPTGEMDKALMFGHGKDFHATSFVTMNELFYQNPGKGGDAVKTETAMKVEGSTGRNRLAQSKKAAWQADNDDSQRYVSAKAASIDASAATPAKEKRDGAGTRPTQKWGSAIKELRQSYRKVGLRSHFPLTKTPLK